MMPNAHTPMLSKDSIRRALRHPFLSDFRTLLGLWLLLALVAAVLKQCNNFAIFRHVFWHTLHQLPLFAPYPAEYADVNHYGPLFSLVIAPFALPPVWLGHALWLLALSGLLYWSIRELPIAKGSRIFILWFCAHELLTALFMSQFNIAIAAIILGSYILLSKEKEPWAALLIVLGTLVKIYGIVGLAFLFFSRHRGRFILWLAIWSVVLFAAPMAISSPEYVVSQYAAWWEELLIKNQGNHFSLMQNISLLGMVRKISGIATYSDLWIIAPGLALFGLPYLRFSQFKHPSFRLFILASVLLFVVLFSTGSESSSYIIALVGASIWYTSAPWKRSRLDLGLMIFAFILTSLSPSDLFPAYIRREFVLPYALKAFPCVLIWLKLSYELLTRDFQNPTADVALFTSHTLNSEKNHAIDLERDFPKTHRRPSVNEPNQR